MDNINQYDEFGRKQGLWIDYYYQTNNILEKRYYLNDGLINFRQIYDFKNQMYFEIFYYPLF